MAKPKKIAPEIPPVRITKSDTDLSPEGLVTGLGETLPEITAKVAAAMKVLAPFIRKDAPLNEMLEAAYQYGLVEKRRRKLARKVGKE